MKSFCLCVPSSSAENFVKHTQRNEIWAPTLQQCKKNAEITTERERPDKKN